jgi:hypothetical protein
MGSRWRDILTGEVVQATDIRGLELFERADL